MALTSIRRLLYHGVSRKVVSSWMVQRWMEQRRSEVSRLDGPSFSSALVEGRRLVVIQQDRCGKPF